MTNVTLLHWLDRGRPGHCPFHIIGQFSLICIIIIPFDLDLFITINVRNVWIILKCGIGDLCTSIGSKLTFGITPHC